VTTDFRAADYRNFLFLIWQHLNLPEPTNAQYDIHHADGVDYVCVEQRTYPSEDGATVDILYNGPLGVFMARSLKEAS